VMCHVFIQLHISWFLHHHQLKLGEKKLVMHTDVMHID
jgi:hypothetical protein